MWRFVITGTTILHTWQKSYQNIFIHFCVLVHHEKPHLRQFSTQIKFSLPIFYKSVKIYFFINPTDK